VLWASYASAWAFANSGSFLPWEVFHPRQRKDYAGTVASNADIVDFF
jgi:hypothetical protein